MIELSNERIEQILHEETTKPEELVTILRGLYTRYMRLYEKYYADIDSLNDEKIAEFKAYHEETISIVKYYHMDIPMDICEGLIEFEEKYSDNLLGPDWHRYLFDTYKEYKESSESTNKSAEYLKEQFVKQALGDFYDAMDLIFRQGLGTGSETTKSLLDGFQGMLFGEDD